MYKVLPIGGKEYKLEYTIEAALYDDCVTSIMEFFAKAFGMENQEFDSDTDSKEKASAISRNAIKNGIAGISNMPSLTITMLYAGLLEHHGTGKNGDRSIISKEDVKELVKDYFSEHSEDGTDTFYDLFQLCIEQMGEDGFFKRVGLEKIVNQNSAVKKNRATRRAEAKTSDK